MGFMQYKSGPRFVRRKRNTNSTTQSMTTSSPFIEETHFGNWFLKSETWKVHVLCRALNDLQRLMPQTAGSFAQVIDVGCGFGHSFDELARRFKPDLIVGMDADPALQERAGVAAAQCATPVRLHSANAARIDLPDDSFDQIGRAHV